VDDDGFAVLSDGLMAFAAQPQRSTSPSRWRLYADAASSRTASSTPRLAEMDEPARFHGVGGRRKMTTRR